MTKLVNSYIMSLREDYDLNCASARVLLNVMPGLESELVFQDIVSRVKCQLKVYYLKSMRLAIMLHNLPVSDLVSVSLIS